MATRRIYCRIRRWELVAFLRSLPAIMAGKAPDPRGIAHGFKMRLAMEFLSKVKQAFIVKSRGGTDEAGISWPPLSKEYLAYQRRFGPGEKARLKRAAGLGKANSRSPGGKEGLMTADQEKSWWAIYRRNLAWLAQREPLPKAKGIAASIAWSEMKRQGVKTMLEVYGSRQVEILRDTGILFNSLSPGELTLTGATAGYQKPSDEGGENQIVRDEPGELLVGTNVAYASAHHHGNKTKKRQLWPDASQIPAAWQEDFADVGASGLDRAIELVARGAA